jgi:gluconate 2-dehydrogenase gamma chain
MSTESEAQDRPQIPGATISRGTLFRRGAFATIAGASIAGGLLAPAAEATRTSEQASAALRFLTGWEYDYVTAMAETIWPTDDLGPGAKVAGVADYIDGQLAGSWGQGHRFYLNGPFLEAQTSGHGWQIPMAPAEVYRAFLPGFDVYCKTRHGNPYPSLAPTAQVEAMTDLQKGTADIQLAGSTAFGPADFFSMFRQNVLEGMLADPAYGGNKDMVGWKWVGFPGDPMQRGDPYEKFIFTTKAYPYEHRPMPLQPRAAAAGTASGAAATGTKPANASTSSSTKMSGMGG